LKKTSQIFKIQKKLSNFEAICFDMDGTLVHTEPLHQMAFQQYLDHHNLGIKIQNPLDYVGLADELVFQQLILPKASHLKCDEFISTKNSFLEVFIEKRETLFDKYILEFLYFLKEQNKKVALVTASEKNIAECIIKRIPRSIFDVVVTAADVQNTKPHPDPYLLAMKLLNVQSKKTLVFEDSKVGIESARSAGAEVIKVEWFALD
jgi:HAD superfamily hydrolase (TIGR01509 family)